MSVAAAAPVLPAARGALSEDVLATLRGSPAELRAPAGDVDAFGDDLQLALYLCYELHYRGFDGVSDELEWDPALLAHRRDLERAFLAALEADLPSPGSDATFELTAELARLRRRPVLPGSAARCCAKPDATGCAKF